MNKTEFIAVRVNAEERKEIKKLADELGLSVSAYIRMLTKKEIKNSRRYLR